jgi:hypothetical protein
VVQLYIATTFRGEITVFLIVYSVEKGSAVNITDGMKNLFQENFNTEYKDIINQIVGLSCDRASMMTGCRNSVSYLIKSDQESLVTIHCAAHRLELSLKDSAKEVKLFDDANSLLLNIYLFYRNSALNRSMLKRCYDAETDEDKGPFLIPTRVGGTRWVGHTDTALKNLIGSYSSIRTHLEQVYIFFFFKYLISKVTNYKTKIIPKI